MPPSDPTPEPSPRYRFPRYERLSKRREIEALFAQGRKAFAFPYRIVFTITPVEQHPGPAMMPVVPKRLFKRAVDRNANKRRIREAYRLQAPPLRAALRERGLRLAVAFLIVSNDPVPYERAYRAIGRLMAELLANVRAYHDPR